MILPDLELRQWAELGGINPYNPAHINPASIDLTLGDTYIALASGEEREFTEFTLDPGSAILASTAEYIKLPASCAGSVFLKSSMARRGLDHALAGWVDPGFEGNLTLELHSHRPIKLVRGMRIIQLVLYRMQYEPAQSYDGRYQGQTGPTMARVIPIYKDGKIA